MTPNDPFLLLVRKMRHAQKAYFADRSADNLQAAKTLERMVDRTIEDLIAPRAEPTLFDRIMDDVEKT